VSVKVVLGVAGGIAAYKAASAAAPVHRGRPRRHGRPHGGRAQLRRRATWSALSGKPVHTDVWSDITAGAARPHRPGGRPGRRGPGDRRPARARRHRAGERPAHQRPAHGAVPGGHGAGHAHRDVGAPGHPGQRRDAQRARGAHRPPGIRPPHGQPTPGPAGCPSPRTCCRLRAPPRPVRRDPTTPVDAVPEARQEGGRPSVVVTAGGTREPSTPCASSATARRASRGTPWRRPRRPRGRRHPGDRVVDSPCRPASSSVRVETALEMQAAVTPPSHGADVVVMAAAVADFRPASYVDQQDQEVTRGRGRPRRRVGPGSTLVRNPDILAGLVAEARGECQHPRSSWGLPPRPATRGLRARARTRQAGSQGL
jgi:phosphopantothenoylcysteine decarboxylase/phosphopantothenate--cysteine ligase